MMIACLVLAGLPSPPAAQTFYTNAGMPVRMEVISSCTVTASDLDFGTYLTTAAAPVWGQTTVQLNCGYGIVMDVSLDAGTGAPGGKTTRRRMSSAAGGNRLDYGLFQDAGRTIHWGDEPGVDTLEVLGVGQAQVVQVYGEIPAGQRVQAGTYSDLITVRLLF